MEGRGQVTLGKSVDDDPSPRHRGSCPALLPRTGTSPVGGPGTPDPGGTTFGGGPLRSGPGTGLGSVTQGRWTGVSSQPVRSRFPTFSYTWSCSGATGRTRRCRRRPGS